MSKLKDNMTHYITKAEIDEAVDADPTNNYRMTLPAGLSNESRSITAVVYDGYSGPSTYPSYNGGTEIKRYT